MGVKSIEFGCQKIDYVDKRKKEIRALILNNQNLSAFREEIQNNGSVSSGSFISQARIREIEENQNPGMSDIVRVNLLNV